MPKRQKNLPKKIGRDRGSSAIEIDHDLLTFFEAAGTGMVIVSFDGKFLRANKYFCEMLGYEENELIGKLALEFTHPLDLEKSKAALVQLKNRETNSIENEPLRIEKRYFHKNGEIVWGSTTVIPIKDSKGKPKYSVAQVENITKEKEAERSANLLLEATLDGFWDWRLNDDYEYMSPRFWEMIGVDPTTKKHHPSEWQKHIFPEDRDLAFEKLQIHIDSRGEIPFREELRYKHANGETVWVLCKGYVVEWDDEWKPLRVVGSHSDITEFKNAQLVVNQTSKMVALGEMAGNIAHEINNPLSIISLAASQVKFLLKKLEKSNDGKDIDDFSRLHKTSGVIDKTTERISKIVKGLKSVARHSSNDPFEIVSATEIIEDALNICGERLKHQEIDVKVNVSENLQLRCRAGEISQIFLNLFSNAADAIQSNSSTSDTDTDIDIPSENHWIEIVSSESQGNVILSVKNSGEKIPKDLFRKIMEPFFTTKPVGSGTGLGLSISKGIANSHGGKLSIDANSDVTKFDLVLPKFAEEDSETSADVA